MIFKSIKPRDIVYSKHIFHKTHILSSSAAGIHTQTYVSGASGPTGSYWDSLRINFYMSGSNQDNDSYFNSPYIGVADYVPKFPIHKNKFHSQKSGSALSIGQKHFGEAIKRGTFTLTDKSTSVTITIKDDGHGNLYPVGHSISQSAATSVSSSDNYVGNIFYNTGIVAITSTGSYSSGKSYSKVGTKNYKVKFDSTQAIYTHEYEIEISPRDYNKSMNCSIRGFRSGSSLYETLNESPYLLPQFTASGWRPYITQIHLYDENSIMDGTEPLVIGTLPRPVQIRDDMTIKFRIKLDM